MLGVPLWLSALGIFALVYLNRALRQRHGDIPLRVLRPGKARWTRGHYRDLATAHPDHVAAIALCQVRPDAQTGDDQEASSINGVSILRGADGDELLNLRKPNNLRQKLPTSTGN